MFILFHLSDRGKHFFPDRFNPEPGIEGSFIHPDIEGFQGRPGLRFEKAWRFYFFSHFEMETGGI